MPDPDPGSLLNDILAASAQPAQPSAAARVRTGLMDLLRLGDADWNRFLMEVAPDDLVVLCSDAAPAWRERVFASLDDVSRSWIRSNLAQLDSVSPALVAEARERALATAQRLIRDAKVALPAAPPDAAKPAAPPAAPAAEQPAAPEKPKPKAAPAPPPISVTFAPPSFVPPPEPEPKPKPKPAPAIDSVTVSFGTGMPAPKPAAPAPTTAPALAAQDEQSLDELFSDLLRLRRQAGASALAPLAAEVSHPFLRSGLTLVASGLLPEELERALDNELARQAEAYIEHLTRLRAGLLALARGEKM